MAKSTPPGFKTKDEILSKRQPNRAAVERSKRDALLEIGLHELRERTGVTQTAIAERMETSRPNVHRIEHEDDLRLSTLERYVRAAGGVLHVEVVLPDGDHVALLGAEVIGREDDRDDRKSTDAAVADLRPKKPGRASEA